MYCGIHAPEHLLQEQLNLSFKLYRVGPVDNKPFTNQLQPFVQMTHGKWGEMNLLSKFQLLSSYVLGVKVF